MKEEKERIV